MIKKKKKKHLHRKKQYVPLFILCVGILCLGMVVIQGLRTIRERHQTEKAGKDMEVVLEVTRQPDPLFTPEPEPTDNPEGAVYTYLQGPKSWSRRIDWSGEWGDQYMDGGYFGGFGCGLCCLANVYSTQSKYQCSPADMYRFAKKSTYYSGGMAIEWGYMRRTLSSLGFSCEAKKKPSDYETFEKSVRKAECCIVLVSSGDSQVYWKNTPGHYVTIFLYDEDKEKVFLADSGDPEHNRQWISLKKIYRSLKTASNWQYIWIGQYDAAKDTWKHKKASGNWVRPEYLPASIDFK